MSRIAVIGAGAWGTALSIVLARRGKHAVRLWALENEVCESARACRMNELFLPGYALPPSVTVSNRFDEVLSEAEIVVSVMPSSHCRRVFTDIVRLLPPSALIVSATKGLEEGSLLRMSQ